jgi:hypothetical protein
VEVNQFHDGTDFSQGVDFLETMLGGLKSLKSLALSESGVLRQVFFNAWGSTIF